MVYPAIQGEILVGAFPTFNKATDGTAINNPVNVTYGLTNQWQASINWNAYQILQPDGAPETQGISDFAVGTQYSWMNINQSPYSTSLAFNTIFPTGDINEGLTDGFIQYQPMLILSRDFSGAYPSQIYEYWL